MTVALIEALALGAALDDGGLDRLGARVLARAAPFVEDAWTLATGADLADPDVEGPRPLSWKLTNAYLERLLPVAHDDPAVAEALVRVIGLLDRPQELFHPALVWRVLRESLAGATPPDHTSARAQPPQPSASRGQRSRHGRG